MDKRFEDEFRWEFLRRNPEYQWSYENLDVLKGEASSNEVEAELLKRWGLEKFFDPKLSFHDAIKFAPIVLCEVLAKDEATYLSCDYHSEHSGQPIQDVTPFYDLAERIVGDAPGGEKRFATILLDLKMFANFNELKMTLLPILEQRFDSVVKSHKPRKSENELRKILKLLDDFFVFAEKEGLPKMKSASEESLKYMLDQKVRGDVSFKKALADDLGYEPTENLEKALVSAFRLMNRSPFISF